MNFKSIKWKLIFLISDDDIPVPNTLKNLGNPTAEKVKEEECSDFLGDPPRSSLLDVKTVKKEFQDQFLAKCKKSSGLTPRIKTEATDKNNLKLKIKCSEKYQIMKEELPSEMKKKIKPENTSGIKNQEKPEIHRKTGVNNEPLDVTRSDDTVTDVGTNSWLQIGFSAKASVAKSEDASNDINMKFSSPDPILKNSEDLIKLATTPDKEGPKDTKVVSLGSKEDTEDKKTEKRHKHKHKRHTSTHKDRGHSDKTKNSDDKSACGKVGKIGPEKHIAKQSDSHPKKLEKDQTEKPRNAEKHAKEKSRKDHSEKTKDRSSKSSKYKSEKPSKDCPRKKDKTTCEKEKSRYVACLFCSLKD